VPTARLSRAASTSVDGCGRLSAQRTGIGRQNVDQRQEVSGGIMGTVEMSNPEGAAASAVGGEVVAVPSLGDAARGAAAVFGQAQAVAQQGIQLGVELIRVAVGNSEVGPNHGDRRFTDPAWTGNPLFHRIEQAYFASAEALGQLVDELADSVDDDRRIEQARFVVTILASALAPTNFLVTNPTALKQAFDTGGKSVVRGLRNFVSDLRNNGGMPSMVDREAFEVGRDLAVTPGAVVARDEVAEVLQYRSTTDTVYERPLLVVPPPIGRFYFLDLRPRRSFVEYAVGQGVQTFLLSWRNPKKKQGDWNLDTYAHRVRTAIDTVREITGSADVNVIGFCAGGIITTTLLNHLAATGDESVHSMSYAVTLLDFAERAPITAFSAENLLRFVRKRSQRKGVITSRQMGAAFTWLRPDDLVFNYWVNNYLMGEKPPAFDVLAWNADGTNLPGALHCQFLDIFESNYLTQAGAMSVLGTPLDLKQISVPTFVTGRLPTI
jgi:polyhydroxyalkanoate synthase